MNLQCPQISFFIYFYLVGFHIEIFLIYWYFLCVIQHLRGLVSSIDCKLPLLLSAAIAKNDKLFKVSHESIMKFEIFFIDDEQLEIYI